MNCLRTYEKLVSILHQITFSKKVFQFYETLYIIYIIFAHSNPLTSWEVMGDADCAFSMCSGVK